MNQFARQATGPKNAMGSEQTPDSWKRQLRSILTLPFIVTGVIPAVLVTRVGQAKNPWQMRGLLVPALFLLGSISILLGLSLMVSTIRLLATAGKCTLVPWDPTVSLVVKGPYHRYQKNVPRCIPRLTAWDG